MASTFEQQQLSILEQLITQQPDNVRPVFTHIAGMLRSLTVASVAHVVDNDTTTQNWSVNNTTLAQRVTALEIRADSVTSDGDNLIARIGKMEATAEQLETCTDTMASDGARAVTLLEPLLRRSPLCIRW